MSFPPLTSEATEIVLEAVVVSILVLVLSGLYFTHFFSIFLDTKASPRNSATGRPRQARQAPRSVGSPGSTSSSSSRPNSRSRSADSPSHLPSSTSSSLLRRFTPSYAAPEDSDEDEGNNGDLDLLRAIELSMKEAQQKVEYLFVASLLGEDQKLFFFFFFFFFSSLLS